ncbi:MAG: hypothetical protein O2931_11560 [Planctomycetota bacterium]|nr:hypothetical protein [Planctomycetota bacterium]MDA1179422.1 hypothetical protein [Planctomycetota bacterium]
MNPHTLAAKRIYAVPQAAEEADHAQLLQPYLDNPQKHPTVQFDRTLRILRISGRLSSEADQGIDPRSDSAPDFPLPALGPCDRAK